MPQRALKNTNAYSPKVEGEMIQFAIEAPHVGHVEVAFNFPYAQKVPMRRGVSGVWELTIGPVEPGLYAYCYYVDGLAIPDPSNPRTEASIKVGWSLVDVPSAKRIDAPKDVPRGVVHRHIIPSRLRQGSSRIYVYSPPGYDRQDSLPVLYLRHGAEHTEESWLVAGCADVIFDNLLAENRVKPMLIVMGYGYVEEQQGGQIAKNRNGREAMRFLSMESITEVIPFVEEEYNVIETSKGRAIAGLSMGAGQAFFIGLSNLGYFSNIGSLSSGLLSDEGFQLDEFMSELSVSPTTINEELDLLWFGCGESDRRAVGHSRLMKKLNKLKIQHDYTEVPGSHEWPTWRRLLIQLLPLLFRGGHC